MRLAPAPRYKPDHTSTIPVVCSFYRQKPRRQHLCIVERLLDCCCGAHSQQFKLYTITPKHQREVFIVTTSMTPLAYLPQPLHSMSAACLNRPRKLAELFGVQSITVMQMTKIAARLGFVCLYLSQGFFKVDLSQRMVETKLRIYLHPSQWDVGKLLDAKSATRNDSSLMQAPYPPAIHR